MKRVSKTRALLSRSGLIIVLMYAAFAVAQAGIGMPAPDISAERWVNSKPLRLADLKGKVVLVEFWTYGCYNCRNVEPYVKAWHQRYEAEGLVVIGVHAPEFSYERVIANVQRYVRDHAIEYPIAIDNDFHTWKRYNNRYWPAMYLIDKWGVIRYLRVGEGGYDQTERQIRALLGETAGNSNHEVRKKGERL